MMTGEGAGDAWPGRWFPSGVSWSEQDGTRVANVTLWAPRAERVELCLFDERRQEHRVNLVEKTFGVYHGAVPGLQPGQEYGFRVHGLWDPQSGYRFNPHKLLLDPRARAITGDLVYNPAVFGHLRTDLVHPGDDLVMSRRDSAAYVPHSVMADETFDWGADQHPHIPWTDTVIYETHVKGFTKLHPEVPPELRGTYAGMAHPAVLEYLVGLGITTVELLPIQHFVDEPHLRRHRLRNFWGYNTIGFFAPHAAYSSAGSHGQQVQEFKAMVKAMHAVGLEVVLDVVYNHTAEGGHDGPTLSLRGIDNPAYYRLRDRGRRNRDYTGCGNTLDTSRSHGLRLVMDSLRYWVREMHVDGFRFDLASALVRGARDVDMRGTFLTALQQDEILRSSKLIAEPWDIGPGGYQVGEFPLLWTEWNDKFRDTVRDFWRGSAPGVRDLGYRLSGSSDLYGDDGRSPYASINLVTAHDGFTMRDLVSYNRKHNEANGEHNRDGHNDNRSWNHGAEGETDDPAVRALRRRQLGNLLSTLLLSAGVPMLLAGDEAGRTQRGSNNAYCQDNVIAWVDWEEAARWSGLTDLVRQLLRLRREHPVFRQSHWFVGRPATVDGRKDLAWYAPDGEEMTEGWWWDTSLQTLGMFLAGDAIRVRSARGERIIDESFLLWLHAGALPVDVVLPGSAAASGYVKVLDTAAFDLGDGAGPGAGATAAPPPDAESAVAAADGYAATAGPTGSSLEALDAAGSLPAGSLPSGSLRSGALALADGRPLADPEPSALIDATRIGLGPSDPDGSDGKRLERLKFAPGTLLRLPPRSLVLLRALEP